MDAAPPGAESIGHLDNAGKVIGVVILEAGLENTLEQAMMLADEFDKPIGPRDIPPLHEMGAGVVGRLLPHPPHGGHKVQEQLGYGIGPPLHGKRGLCNADAPAIFPGEIGAVRIHLGSEQTQALGKVRGSRTKLVLAASRFQVQENARRRGKHNVRSANSGVLAGKAVLPHGSKIVEAGFGKGNLPA